MADNPPTGEPDDATSDRASVTARREAIIAAVAEVHQEARKAVAVHAVIDALVLFVFLTGGLLLLGLHQAGPTVVITVPGPFLGLGDAVGLYIPAMIPVAAVDMALIAVTLTVGLGDAWLRYRTYDIDRFEAYNPELREAFRTARDVANDDTATPVANQLYADVLATLQSASTTEFIRWRQIYVALGIVLLGGLVGAGAFVTGLPIGDAPTAGADDDTPTAAGTDGDRFLGAESPVERGSETREVVLEGSDGDSDTSGTYDAGDFDVDPDAIKSSQAAFTETEQPENADLIREYYEYLRGDNE